MSARRSARSARLKRGTRFFHLFRSTPRRPFLYALAICLLLSAAAVFVPSPQERTEMELHGILLSGLQDSQKIRDAKFRTELISLLGRLVEQGDERGAWSLSPAWQSSAFTGSELDEIADITVRDFETWNTALPPWKAQFIKKWASLRDPHRQTLLSHAFDSYDVSLTFDDTAEKYPRLYLSGNWNANGEIDDLNAWKELPLRCDGGRCAIHLKLDETRAFHPYHAVIRTGIWPRGEVVGHAAFYVPAQTDIKIAENKDRPIKENYLPPRGRRGNWGRSQIRLAVIILDGASWQAIMPLAERGFLPNFARLLRESAAATLVSSGQWYPSEPNIYSALTGKLAFRHGMKEYFALSSSLKASPLWTMASRRGLSVTVLGVPNTFPPVPVNGSDITDAFLAGAAERMPGSAEFAASPAVTEFASQFGVDEREIRGLIRILHLGSRLMATTYPEALGDRLLATLSPVPLRADEGVLGITELLDRETLQAAPRLLEENPPPDLFCVYLHSTDAGSHMFWDQLEPGDIAKPDHFVETYQRADQLLGLLLSRAENLIVFSDHGSGPSGYHPIERLDPIKLLKTFNETFKASSSLKKEVVLESHGADWVFQVSRRYGADQFADDLVRFLRSARYLPSGQPMFSNVLPSTGSREISIHFTHEQPHPAVVYKIELGGRNYPVLQVFGLSKLQGIHMGNGIVAIRGPNVTPRRLKEPAFIPDIAPTALYLLGAPIAKDMDGQVITSAFSNAYLDSHPPRYIESYGTAGSGWWNFMRDVRWDRILHRLF